MFEAYEKFENKNKGKLYTIFNSSVLYEKKWSELMNKTITVYTPFVTRLERGKKILFQNNRYIDKDGNLHGILKKEIDEAKKKEMASYVINSYYGYSVAKQVNTIDSRIVDSILIRDPYAERRRFNQYT